MISAPPKPDIGRERVGDVSADDEKAAMREIDYIAKIEDER